MLRLSQVHRAGKHLPAKLEEPDGLDPEQRSLWRALQSRFATADADWILSLTWRLIALSDLIASGALDEWVISEGGGEIIIPDEVVEVAAGLPLARYQPFNIPAFLDDLRREAHV